MSDQNYLNYEGHKYPYQYSTRWNMKYLLARFFGKKQVVHDHGYRTTYYLRKGIVYFDEIREKT